MTLLGIKDPETGEIKEIRPKLPHGSRPRTVSSDLTGTKQQNALASILRYVSEISGVTAEIKRMQTKRDKLFMKKFGVTQ